MDGTDLLAMAKLQVVIFDMDGVLINSEPIAERMMSVLVGEAGVTIPSDEIARCRGMTGIEFWTHMIERHGLPESVEYYRDKMKPETLAYGPELAAPGIKSLLGLLQESRLKMGVGTSSSRPRMHKVLDTLEIRGFFGAMVSGDDVTKSKPDPTVFQTAARQLECTRQHCLVIEDSMRGIEAARAAGMTAIGYSGLGATSDSLSAADAVLESFVGVTPETLRAIHASAR